MKANASCDGDACASGAGAATGWIEAGGLLGEGIRLIFTDRSGGFSPPPFDSLNLALHTGDERGNVLRNRGKVAEAVGVEERRFLYMQQVHGLRVARAGMEDAERGVGVGGCTLAATDGAVTTERGLVLTVLTADCVPIALAEPAAGAICMLHAGWRGTIGGIVGVAVGMMKRELGLEPGKLRAVMGPSIGPCCYEVDEGRARRFVEKYGRESGVLAGGEGRRVDLLRANRIELLEAGLREENVSEVGGCTCCERRYFSFRRDGVTGRQGAFVFLL